MFLKLLPPREHNRHAQRPKHNNSIILRKLLLVCGQGASARYASNILIQTKKIWEKTQHPRPLASLWSGRPQPANACEQPLLPPPGALHWQKKMAQDLQVPVDSPLMVWAVAGNGCLKNMDNLTLPQIDMEAGGRAHREHGTLIKSPYLARLTLWPCFGFGTWYPLHYRGQLYFVLQ